MVLSCVAASFRTPSLSVAAPVGPEDCQPERSPVEKSALRTRLSPTRGGSSSGGAGSVGASSGGVVSTGGGVMGSGVGVPLLASRRMSSMTIGAVCWRYA